MALPSQLLRAGCSKRKREEMSPSALLPVLSPVSVNMLHSAFIVVLNFWLCWDIAQKGQESSACSMTFTATDNCFLPSERGGRILTMTKEHRQVSQLFCRSLKDLSLPWSLEKKKSYNIWQSCVCIQMKVSSVSK